MILGFLMGVREALAPFLTCLAVTVVMVVLLLTHTLFTFLARPFLTRVDRVMTYIISSVMTVAGVLELVFVITKKETLVDLMEDIMLVLAMLLLVRAVLDALNFIRKLMKIFCGLCKFRKPEAPSPAPALSVPK